MNWQRNHKSGLTTANKMFIYDGPEKFGAIHFLSQQWGFPPYLQLVPKSLCETYGHGESCLNLIIKTYFFVKLRRVFSSIDFTPLCVCKTN